MGILRTLNDVSAPTGIVLPPWKPTQLGSQLKGWWKDDAGATVSGGNVTSLADQSTTGTALGGSMPLVADAVGSLPVLRCSALDGSQYLASASTASALAFDYNVPFTLTVAILYSTEDSRNGGNHIFCGYYEDGSYTGYRLGAVQVGGAAKLTMVMANSAATQAMVVAGSTTLVNGTVYVITVTMDGTGHAAGVTILLNNVPETLTVQADTLASTIVANSACRMYISAPSADLCPNSGVGEVLLMSGALSSANASAMAAYLANRW